MEPADRSSVDALLAEGDWLHRLALRLVTDSHAASDAAQDALVTALERPPSEAVPSRRWLAGVLRNVVRERRRREARRTQREKAREPRGASEATAELVARLELHQRLLQQVRELDEPYRATVALRFLEDLSVAEIARRQGVPLQTVYTRLDRALARLRTRLDREHGSRDAWALVLLPLLHREAAAAAPASVSIMTTLQWTATAAVAVTLGLAGWDFVGRDGPSTPTERRVESLAATAAASIAAADDPQGLVGGPPPIDASNARRPLAAIEEPADSSDALPISRPFVGAVVVRLVLSDGAPAADAEAAVFASPPRDTEQRVADEEQRIAATPHQRPFGLTRDWQHDAPTQRMRADELGRVYVSGARDSTVLRARFAAHGVVHRAVLGFDEEDARRPGAEHTLVLQRVETASVRVSCEDGAPAAGVIAAVVIDAAGPRPWSTISAGLSDADGVVRFEDVTNGWTAARERGANPRIRALVPAAMPIEVPLVAGSEASLVLPPTGSVVIDLAAAPSNAWVTLGVAGDVALAWVRPSEGRAVFAHVGLGIELDVSLASERTPPSERFAGPRSAGEMVAHRWSTAREAGLWRAALLDEARQPLSDRLINVVWNERGAAGAGGASSTFALTDGAGVLRYGPPRVTPNAKVRLHFSAYDAERTDGRRNARRAAIDVPAAQSTDALDLGTVVLARASLLASGIVVDRNGQPVADATVQAVEAGSATAPERASHSNAWTDASGRFVLWGPAPSADVELVAHAPGYAPIAPRGFERGARDVVLTVDPAAHVVATVQLPEGVGTWALAVFLEREGGARDALFVPSDAAHEPDDSVWRRDDVTAGPARLVVVATPSGDELFRHDVVLAAGERLDVGVVDLGARLPTFELTVIDDMGTPIRSFSARYADAPHVARLSCHDNPVRLPRPRDGGRIEVSATGFLPAVVEFAGDRVTVALRRAAEVTLRLPAGFPGPAEGAPLHLGFQRRSGDEAQGSFPFVPLAPDNVYRVNLGAPGRFVARVFHAPESSHNATVVAQVEFEVTGEDVATAAAIELPFDLATWTAALEVAR